MELGNYFRNLSHADLQKAMQICAQLHDAAPETSFIQHCHAAMNTGFSNVHFSAERYCMKPFAMVEQTLDSVDEKLLPLFVAHIHEHPFAERMFTLTVPDISMTHIERSLSHFRKSTLYNDFYDVVQAQNQLWIALPNGNELLTCVYSRETEFTEDELAMMCMIQPHLESAWENWKRTRSLKQELDLLKGSIFRSEEEAAAAARIRKSIDALTARQRDVVELVADGKDNQQIADELKISTGTVKKHLQMVFQVLEVEHRTALAAQWHQAHSLSLY